jgi:hypothetical protein
MAISFKNFHPKDSLRNKLQKFVSSFLFPAKKFDWYKSKGYNGANDQERFQDFLDKQTHYKEEFKDLNIQRTSVINKLNNEKIDSVSFSPVEKIKKPGNGKHIVNFFGANTYYEGNFRDMALEAKTTGATLYGFNYPGFNSSDGQVLTSYDLINSGIAFVNNLLEKGIHPDDIILQGNCFGAVIGAKVKDHFKKNDIKLRSINSNSFLSFESAVNDHFDSHPILKPFRKLTNLLLRFTGWDLDVSQSVKRQDPYLFTMNRLGDQTLKKSQVSHVIKDNADWGLDDECPVEYREIRDEFEERSIVQPKSQYVGANKNSKKNDPHEMDLYKLETQNGESVFEFINEYLEASNNYIEDGNRQVGPFAPVPFVNQVDVQIDRTERAELEKLSKTLEASSEIKANDNFLLI